MSITQLLTDPTYFSRCSSEKVKDAKGVMSKEECCAKTGAKGWGRYKGLADCKLCPTESDDTTSDLEKIFDTPRSMYTLTYTAQKSQ